jgi:hypothetical protein
LGLSDQTNNPLLSLTRLHAELLGLLRQHSRYRDLRHLVMLAWMTAGLLLSQTVCFDRWKDVLPLGSCLAASWQRRCQRWLANGRIEIEPLYGPLILWALRHWQKPGQHLHLALDTTMLWNSYCVVVLSAVCHGRAVPLLWTTLEHPSASVSSEICIALLHRADALLCEFGAITLLADRAFPSSQLLGWFEQKPRWTYVMRLRGDTPVHGTAAPLGCEVRRLRLGRGHCRGFHNVELWGTRGQRANLLLAHPSGVSVDEPWYLVTNAPLHLDLVWTYARRFWCEELFRDQKSGLFQLESSGLRHPERMDHLLLVVAIAVLVSSLQGYAISMDGLRRQVDPHWQRGMSFVRLGLKWLQQDVANASDNVRSWAPIPLRELEACIPSCGVQRRQKQPWFTRIELPPRPRVSEQLGVA